MGDETSILALAAAVLAASLLGSPHCAGMCGALALFAVHAGPGEPQDKARPSRWRAHAAYHAGRGLSYALLGAGAGALGLTLNRTGDLAGVQRGAALAAGALMVTFGLAALLRGVGVARVAPRLPAFWSRRLQKLHYAAMGLPASRRAAAVGLLTPLLPCGWLYAFAATAAATGGVLPGAALMVAFWLGTLPVMAAVSVGLQALTGPLRARLPMLTALLVLGMGLFTVLGRVSLTSIMPEGTASASSPAGVRAAIQRVRSLTPAEVPCCNAPPTTATVGVAGSVGPACEGVTP